MGIQRGPKIVTSGLVLALDAANKNSYVSGSKNVFDLAGTSVTGSLKNGVGFSNTNVGNFVFDGTNDFVNCGTGLSQAGSFTISAWFKRNGTGTGIICSRTEGPATYKQNYVLFVSSSNAVGFSQSSDSYKRIMSTTSTANNTWYEVTGTYDTTTNTMRLYVNGVSENSTTLVTDPPTDGSQYFLLGASDGTSPANWLKGSVASVKLYNRLLSAAEVLQNYNATRARFGL